MNMPLIWIFKRVKKRIPEICIMTAANVGTALLGVAFAVGTSNVIDSAAAGGKESFIRASLVQGAIIIGILLCLTLNRHLYDKLTAELDRDWKRDMLHGIIHGEYNKVAEYHSAELVNRLTNDVRIVDEGLLSAMPNAISMIARLLSAVAVMLSMEPWFTVLIIVAGIAVVVVTGFMRRSLKGLHKKVSEHDGRVAGFIQETMEKLLMVQAMDLSAEIEHRNNVLLDDRYIVQRKRRHVTLFANTSVSIMSYCASFIALVWCAFKLLRGQITFGGLTAVTQLVNQLQGPFVNLSAFIPKYVAMTAAAERLMELEALTQEPLPGKKADELYAEMTAIAADGLCFSYDRDIVLKNAKFILPKGAFAVITGPSGIGKSTLLKLMLGVFTPEQGEMYVQCGEERVRIDRTTRRLFAYVPQGNLLFSGTIRENLVVAKPEASEDEINKAVYVSAMEDYLQELPNGLDTVLGESGAGLSEGQAQRVAIARAVIGGAPILLLDECTSALDADTEKKVLERICKLKDCTCIAVTHRMMAAEMSDYNLVMDGEKITVIQNQ